MKGYTIFPIWKYGELTMTVQSQNEYMSGGSGKFDAGALANSCNFSLWLQNIDFLEKLSRNRGAGCCRRPSKIHAKINRYLQKLTDGCKALLVAPLVKSTEIGKQSHDGQKNRIVILGRGAPKISKKSWREIFGTIDVKVRSLSRSKFRKFDP